MQIICYVAYKEYFKHRAADIFAENHVNADILVYSEETVAELPSKGYLALLARGGTAEELRQRVDIPVIDIPVSFQDITDALLHASQYGRKIGVVGYGNFLNHLNRLNPILNVEITQVIAKTAKETRQQIEVLRKQDIDVIIGGFQQTEIAAELGMHHVLLDLYEDSLMDAYYQAQVIAESALMNARKREEVNTVLCATKEAFLAIDWAGMITMANPAALKLNRMHLDDVINRPLAEVFPSMTRLLEVLSSKRECLRETMRVGKTDILCDMLPLQMQDGRIVGAIATFSDVNIITKKEHLVRNRLYGKGLYAAYTFDEIIHKSQSMKDLIHMAKRYAASDSSVLITGETGVGKELFAQSIHNASARRKEAFVAINCASIPESILESELFGYEEGAFTGAKRNGKPGYFELAHKGTIFLDEIGEMPFRLQARLLRVLQEKRVMRLGGNQVIPIDIRIIAATNQNLPALVEQGTFRADLFYRLNVLKLQVPPLRQRSEDIPELIDAYLREHSSGFWLTEQATALLRQADWPGNVRQLYNFIERLDVLMEKREVREADILRLMEPACSGETHPSAKPAKGGTRMHPTAEDLRAALVQYHGNRQAAADFLGIHRSTLWRLMKKYEINL